MFVKLGTLGVYTPKTEKRCRKKVKLRQQDNEVYCLGPFVPPEWSCVSWSALLRTLTKWTRILAWWSLGICIFQSWLWWSARVETPSCYSVLLLPRMFENHLDLWILWEWSARKEEGRVVDATLIVYFPRRLLWILSPWPGCPKWMKDRVDWLFYKIELA